MQLCWFFFWLKWFCKMKIGIVDYGCGNLQSLKNAFAAIGAKSAVSSSACELEKCGGLLLPGVGAFEAGAAKLRERKLDDFVLNSVGRVPVLGVCLGMQLLLDESEEVFSRNAKSAKGLGLVGGKVIRFWEKDLKVPQIGWNKVLPSGESPLFLGLESGFWAYFVHSYYAKPSNAKSASSLTNYGQTTFASAVEDRKRKIFGVQFHPEKSGADGLRVLENFVDFCGKNK